MLSTLNCVFGFDARSHQELWASAVLLDQLSLEHPAFVSPGEGEHCWAPVSVTTTPFPYPFPVSQGFFLLKIRKCKVHTNQIANNPFKWLVIQMKKPHGLLIRRRNQINKYLITWWQGGGDPVNGG